jgi:circadian clock protein KaiC
LRDAVRSRLTSRSFWVLTPRRPAVTNSTRPTTRIPAIPEQARARTGIAGLDDVLGGGLPTNHVYLLDGEPGAGKTTLALQFLLEGAAVGERGLYVTLSESKDELAAVAASHGWSLAPLSLFELAENVSDRPGDDEEYTIFHPAEVELQQTIEAVFDVVEKVNPTRVVFDSLSEMRLLARDPLRFRRQILALKQFFAGRRCTVLLLDDKSAPDGDMQLHSLAHGVILLEHMAMEYGAERRRLRVTKLRGVRFWGGFHDFRIRTGGIAVYPRIRKTSPPDSLPSGTLASGDEGLEALLGGGLTLGTSTLITGAAGTGKTVLSLQYVCAAVARGERARLYMFDERLTTFRMRARGLGMNLDEALADGRLTISQLEPTEMSPGEFANAIVDAIERDGVSLIVIDSINGYMNSMPSERLLGVQVHELLTYMANRGVTSILTLVQRGIFGGPVEEEAEVSVLADTVVLLRYFEFQGSVRNAISVVKKRSGQHEKTIRECRVEEGGIVVGAPLHQFQGVLTGVPEYLGERAPLMPSDRRVPSSESA